jgi:hypothetical protein
VYISYQCDLLPTTEDLNSTSGEIANEPCNLTLLQRIARNDKTALKECFEAYQDLIWNLSRRFTGSDEAAEMAMVDIFRDISNYSGDMDGKYENEVRLITFIACRRLLNLDPSSRVLFAGST